MGALLLGMLAAGPSAGAEQAQKDGPGHETPLAQAREESSVENRPRNRFDIPAGDLRLAASELLAAGRERVELSVTLDRAVRNGALEVTLPSLWLATSPVSGLPFAQVPKAGRSGREVSLPFADARVGDSARFAIQDVGIPAGTYELPFRWRENGRVTEEGVATVIFYAPVRESGEPRSFTEAIPPSGLETNVTLDSSEESETFVTVVPGNRNRFVVGANGGGGYNAWVTNDGGQTFTRASMPSRLDAPGGTESGALCCDPMSAADAAGNIWYGGLSFANGAGNPSRIVVNRIAPGLTSFQPQTVGLPVRTSGTQDKPMMTIDNSPASPHYGRLYVTWNEPSGGGINIALSACDTRPGGTPNAARCDDASNWSTPISVTPATGSYIYADVATGPDGTVYAVWWDYSAANAIRGDSCGPASNCLSAAGWGTPQTVATLDATGAMPIPFACPILAQPGGRASTSPQVDVDRSGGPHHGRVYVSWSDLRTGSGTTRCAGSTTPQSTHLSFDSFVASASGALPGGAAPSPSVATRLLTDGEGGGQANSDDWFPWLAVDQTTGQAWADFYSTRLDSTRRQTHFYARSVTPVSGGHTLGPLTRLTTAPSDYSTAPCCSFGNDYGDYTGIDATQGVAIAVWSDKRAGSDGEAYTYVAPGPSLSATTRTIGGGDGDGVLEPGESFTLVQNVVNGGALAATGVTSTVTETLDEVALTQASSPYPDIPSGQTRANATPFAGSLSASATCGEPVELTLQVATGQGPFLVPVSIPTGQVGPGTTSTNGTSVPIPDNDPAGAASDISVADAGRVADVNAGVNASHSWVSDLEITLESPAGTTVTLFSRHGGSGDDLSGTSFDDEAANDIAAGSPPFTGSFRPDEPLSAFDGEPAAGTWTLRVVDTQAFDTGTLGSWSLTRQTATCSPPPPASHGVSVARAGTGTGTVTSPAAGIDCGADCTESLPQNTVVTLTAAPAASSTFAGWAGCDSAAGATCTVTMNAARTVTATFDLRRHALTVAKSGSGAGTVTSAPGGIDCGAACSAGYDHGQAVTLTATPAAGSAFTGWSGACSGTGPCTVTMTAAQSVGAAFDAAIVPDTTAPALTLAVAARHSLRTVRTRGVPLRATCSETCTFRAELRLPRALARRLRLPQVVGSLSRSLAAGRQTSLSIRLTRAAARKFGTRRSTAVTLRVTVKDAAGNTRAVSRNLTIRR